MSRKQSSFRFPIIPFLFTVFTLSFLSAIFLSLRIHLPFSNPWEVLGPLSRQHYNPLNNILRFLLIIILPSLALSIFAITGSRKKWFVKTTINTLPKYQWDDKHSAKITFILVSFLIMTLYFSGTIYLFHNTPLKFDTFHEGECLGPVINFIDGGVPFKDFIIMHGPIENIYLGLLSFKLFGMSITSFRTLQSIGEIVSFLLFLFCLYHIFEKNPYYFSLASGIIFIILTLKPFGLGLCHWHTSRRDIFLFLFLIAAAAMKRRLPPITKQDRKKIHAILFLFTFISSLSFTYTIDRGIYLSLLGLIISFTVYFLYLKKYSFKFLFSILGGFTSGFLIFGFSIRWAYADFIIFLSRMPEYKELMDGLIFNFRNQGFLFPVFLIGLMLFFLVYFGLSFFINRAPCFFKGLKELFRHYFMEIVLLLTTIIFFRNALGRADYTHLEYSMTLVYISAVYFFIKHILVPLLKRVENGKRTTFVLIGLIYLFLMSVCLPSTNFKTWFKFPQAADDFNIIPNNYHRTIQFLASNLEKDEYFVTTTNEAAWYYFLKQPSPTRFLVAWYAIPTYYQEGFVDDLKGKNVKFVLYKNRSWWNQIDGISNEQKLPVIFDFIKKHYQFYRLIDDNEIWINKSYLE